MVKENPQFTGAGPWKLTRDAQLDPGEEWPLHLREMRFKGTPGFFRRYTPLDTAKVTNRDTGNRVEATINGVYHDEVNPNSELVWDDAQVVDLRLVNAGGSAIAASDLVVTLTVDGYTETDHARRKAQQGPLSSVVENFTGVQL